MSWYSPEKYGRQVVDVNKEFLSLQGELDEKTARITLAKFLYRNLGFTTELLTGLKLYPDQIINIKGLLNSNYSMCVWGRGLGKSSLYSSKTQLITKNNGLVPITSLFTPDFSKEEHWMDIPEINLWNGSKYTPTNKILVQPKKKCVRLVTRMGYSYSGSTVHKIKVWDSEKREVVWSTYDKIKVGDHICIDKNPVDWANKTQISEKDAYLIGKNLGEKHIPDSVGASKSTLRKCLQGIFDGRSFVKDNGKIQFASTCERLVEQIHVALLTFGVVSSLIPASETSCVCLVEIGTEFLPRFYQEIGVNCECKKIENEALNNDFFLDAVERFEDLGEQNCIDFNVPDGEMYWGNGFINHNTFSAALFCILQCIFFPKSKILIAGPTFRTARFIFTHIENICNSDDGQLLFQAMGIKSKRNDEFRWNINNGEIVAIPLNGEKIRGFRANVLVIDEFLLMSEEIVEKVLMPFLLAPQDISERQTIRRKEDELIRRGLLKEEERMKFPNNAKLVTLSSASYSCEYLYKKYDEFVKEIYRAEMPENGAKYFVSQMAYNAIPADRIDKSIIEMAQSNESNSATFKREYGAQFIDGSESYFSMKKMIACTIPDGQGPHILLKGNPGEKYIVSIDPNFSNSPTADHFAMCVIEIDSASSVPSGTVVHNYAKAGKDLKDHIKYFYYLLKNFNVEMVIIDYAGYQFIEAANESEWFRRDRLEIKIFEFCAEKDGAELEEQLKVARRNFNKEIQRIAFNQYFTCEFIRKGNEWLQGAIDYKRIWFGSNIKADESTFDKSISGDFAEILPFVDEESVGDFIDTQEILMRQAKYECASIEVKTTAKGTQSFDLPVVMRRDSTATRMRRDSYTALMLGCWALKQYFDLKNAPDESQGTFEPILM